MAPHCHLKPAVDKRSSKFYTVQYCIERRGSRSAMVAAERIRQIAVPATARALCGLSRIDYADAFFVESDYAEELTGQQWASAVLADAPTAVRGKLLAAWAA